MEITHLQCVRCRSYLAWYKDDGPPGQCYKCGRGKGFRQDSEYRVLKEKPESVPGHVIVISDKGWQKLHGPGYRENPDKWEK